MVPLGNADADEQAGTGNSRRDEELPSGRIGGVIAASMSASLGS
jgi:hypothetical protein